MFGQVHGVLLAAKNGHTRVGKLLLLDCGTDPKINAQDGIYVNAAYADAFQTASSRGYEAVVQLLLNSGAEVNAL
ncbi:hypothetical protein HBI81_130140 [Parastagonospora nodorum]|nr:hypothetical protein HBI09_149390 [Parastagonospora nodorum]KAH4200881.1 hypothetical protein HBI95_168540 [Parastagonospora nodorum]KAH4534036.1 hypothetical protein HBH87_020180 [Parastagonospora nodorum]KAH4628076.1 hypothetical protein HBH81_174530 [Parastagonospora nodorum]KAH5826510.1 hypothetical protein HBI93_150100 [Parastagonospora nodorum]